MIVVYTAIFGASDTLKQAPLGADRCVCFTDGHIEDRGWKIIRKAEQVNPRKAARLLKTTPDLLFPKASLSVWVDGSIEIHDLPAIIEDSGEADLACFAHPDRSDCYAEGKVVIGLDRADPTKINAALNIYRGAGFAPTSLSTTGLFVRRHSSKVSAFNRLWRDCQAMYGTNDQIHVDYCAWKTGLSVKRLRGHYRENPYATYDRIDHHARRQNDLA